MDMYESTGELSHIFDPYALEHPYDALETPTLDMFEGLEFRTGKAMRLEVFQSTPHLDLACAGMADPDQRHRVKAIQRQLSQSGHYRQLARPPESMNADIQALCAEFPNFELVIDQVIYPHLCMLQQGYAMRLAPILLVGPAGVGKTHFANRLAHVCGLSAPVFVSMAEEDNGAGLIGSSSYWANTRPGQIFNTLAWGPIDGGEAVANPIIVLDELDKAASSEKGKEALGCLYRLLEEETAKNVQDRSLPELSINASQVRFIATANDLDLIPGPLRSRLEVFEISAPSPAQRQAIANNMLRQLIARHELPLQAELAEEVLQAMLALEPRQLKNKLQLAVQYALIFRQSRLTLEHWHLANANQRRERRAMGFLG